MIRSLLEYQHCSASPEEAVKAVLTYSVCQRTDLDVDVFHPTRYGFLGPIRSLGGLATISLDQGPFKKMVISTLGG